MMNLRNFSVLVPVHNRSELEETFPKSIAAILSNSVMPRQIIIVLDGKISWDIERQLDIVPQNIEKTIYYKSKNEGLTAALNDGLKVSKFDVVARVDADDFCRSHRFEEQLQYMDRGFDLVGGWIQEIDFLGKNLSVRRVPDTQEKIMKFALRRNPFNHMTIMLRKSKVLEAGGYPEMVMKEDYALWVKMLSMSDFKCCNLSEILVDATTGKDFFRRRGSLSAFRSEVAIQLHLIKHLQKPFILSVFDLAIRVFMYLTPIIFVEKIYQNILRR